MAQNENKNNDYRSERKKRIAKAAKKAKKPHDSVATARCVIIIIAVVAVLAALCGGLYAYGIPQRYTTAMKVGDRSYSVAEYNYYYASVYQTYAYQAQSYKQQYGITLGFDPAKDLTAQTIKQDDKDITYDEFFRNYVEETLESNNYYLALAEKAGIELSQESKDAIENTISEIKTACEGNYSVDRYISLLYGNGLNEKTLRKLLAEQYTVSQYREQEEKNLSDSISMEDIEAKYKEDPSDYQRADIRLFGFEIKDGSSDEKTTSASTTGETATSAETTTKAATEASTAASNETTAAAENNENSEKQVKLAQEMLGKITDEASFTKLAKEYASAVDKEKFDDDTATLLKAVKKSTVSSNIDKELAEWLFNTERKAGDKTTCTTSEYVYVIYIIKPVYRIETPLASARHILISFDNVKSSMETAGEVVNSNEETATASDGTVIKKGSKYSVPVILKAYEQAKSILDQYKAGEQTEEAFAELANKNSSDTSSTQNDKGGLYEDIEIGKMVEPFENWVYNADRKPGDVDIIETSYGWHIMYFVSKHDEAEWIETIRHSIVDEKLNADAEEIKKETGDTAETTAFTSFAGKNALKFVTKNYVARYAAQNA